MHKHNTRPGGGDIVVEISSSASAAAGSPQHERVIPHSGTLSKKSTRKSLRFVEPVTAAAPLPAPPLGASPSSAANDDDDDDNDYVEITLDMRDDSVAVAVVHGVEPAHAGPGDDPNVTRVVARPLENHRRSSSYGHSLTRNASSRFKFKQVSQEIRRVAGGPRTDLSTSAAAHALKGLRFISKAEGSAGWEAVKMRFRKLANNGLLHRSMFAECIGG